MDWKSRRKNCRFGISSVIRTVFPLHGRSAQMEAPGGGFPRPHLGQGQDGPSARAKKPPNALMFLESAYFCEASRISRIPRRRSPFCTLPEDAQIGVNAVLKWLNTLFNRIWHAVSHWFWMDFSSIWDGFFFNFGWIFLDFSSIVDGIFYGFSIFCSIDVGLFFPINIILIF